MKTSNVESSACRCAPSSDFASHRWRQSKLTHYSKKNPKVSVPPRCSQRLRSEQRLSKQSSRRPREHRGFTEKGKSEHWPSRFTEAVARSAGDRARSFSAADHRPPDSPARV